jgi:hypothetical protein
MKDEDRPNKTTSPNAFKRWAGCDSPALCQMAFDHLPVPAMSSENKGAFLGARLVIPDNCMRLGPDVVEALECLHYWGKGGL